MYLPNPSAMGKIWQGQFLNWVKLVWIQSSPSPRLVALQRLENPIWHTTKSLLIEIQTKIKLFHSFWYFWKNIYYNYSCNITYFIVITWTLYQKILAVSNLNGQLKEIFIIYF